MLQSFLLWLLPYVMLMVIQLALERQDDCEKRGRALSNYELAIAEAVGVHYPKKVRLLFVDLISPPRRFILRTLAKVIGMDLSKAEAITFGHGITMRKDAFSLAILAHELRHVYQYEQLRMEPFLESYLRDVITHGYAASWPEVDAQAFAAKAMQ